MSSSLMERVQSDGAETVRPNQALSVSESSRALAEVQAQLTVAQSRPRDQLAAIERIKNACQRQRLAEGATYQYSKGGNKISGPSVRLLECVAQNWGNIQFGFRELSQGGGESTVEAFAWDMETNTKRSLVFVVPHKMKSGNSFKPLTDPRDIYEHVANHAQRRVRSCLENVIPRDIVDDAVDECDKTLKESVDITPESIKKMVATFQDEFGVTQGQIEARIQRKIEAIAPGQFVGLRRIYNSLIDGMSEVTDWFKPLEQEEPESSKQQSTTDKLRKSAKPAKKTETTKEPTEPVQSAAKESTAKELVAAYKKDATGAASFDDISEIAASLESDDRLSDSDKKSINQAINKRIEELKAK